MKYLENIVFEISVESSWRELLFRLPFYNSLLIDQYSAGLSDDLVQEIRLKNLRYRVSVIPHHEAKGWEDWDPTLVYFRFEADECSF